MKNELIGKKIVNGKIVGADVDTRKLKLRAMLSDITVSNQIVTDFLMVNDDLLEYADSLIHIKSKEDI